MGNLSYNNSKEKSVKAGGGMDEMKKEATRIKKLLQKALEENKKVMLFVTNEQGLRRMSGHIVEIKESIDRIRFALEEKEYWIRRYYRCGYY